MASSEKDRKKRLVDWALLGLAIFCGIGMWYWVSEKERIEAQVEVNLDYVGVPSNLVVTNGLINKITVRLRGPQTMIRSLLRQHINRTIDLKNIKLGVTSVPLTNTEFSPQIRRFDIIDIEPPKLVITADNYEELAVPVRPIVESPLEGVALTVENLTVFPAMVTLKGAASVIADLPYIPVIIHPDPGGGDRKVDQTISLDTPSLVAAFPPSVDVSYTITSARTEITLKEPIVISGDMARQFSITPKELSVTVEVPEVLAKSSTYLKGLEFSVVPPALEPGESRKVKVRIKLPEGMTLPNPVPQEVTITRSAK